MRRNPVLGFLIVGIPLAIVPADAVACPITLDPLWETVDRAAWFGLLEMRCELVPLTDEELESMRQTEFELAEELEVVDTGGDEDDEPLPDPRSDTPRVVAWRAVRTFSGEPASIPDARSAGWDCDPAVAVRVHVVAFARDGSLIQHRLSFEQPTEDELEGLASWIRRAVELRRHHGERLNVRHRVDWVVDGIVDPHTRRIAIGELQETGWSQPEDTTLGSGDRDRILRAFVRRPDVPGTLNGILWVLRDEPSLVVDLAVVDAMNAELARVEGAESRRWPRSTTSSLTIAMARLGVPDAHFRVGKARGELERLWKEVLCEKGYAARFECEPDPELTEGGAAQP